MFEFGRELRRLLSGDAVSNANHDSLTGGDATLLELLDLHLLTNEARAADIAAGRIGNKDRPARLLQAAACWRELARRSGDATALRKAAAAAEAAVKAHQAPLRVAGFTRGLAEQGLTALLGAELFGDDGLSAAADHVLADAARGSGVGAALGAAALAGVQARRAAATGDAADVASALAAWEAPLAALAASGRASASARLAVADFRAQRADLLGLAAGRLKDADLADHAVRESKAAMHGLDPAYEPLTYARAVAAYGVALSRKAELTADVDPAADGVDALTAALDPVDRTHSPMDWVRIQAALGQALLVLGEITDSPRAFEQAATCFERAALGLKDQTALALRARVAAGKAQALGRQAELTGDLAVLDAAVAAQKTELCALRPSADPVAWGVAQLNLARLYEIRAEITGRDNGGLAGAAVALAAAFDVFAEHGHRSLTDLAAQALERLRARQHSAS